MQSRTGGVGEHVEDVEFLFSGDFGGAVCVVVAPILLPALFDFAMIIIHCVCCDAISVMLRLYKCQVSKRKVKKNPLILFE